MKHLFPRRKYLEESEKSYFTETVKGFLFFHTLGYNGCKPEHKKHLATE